MEIVTSSRAARVLGLFFLGCLSTEIAVSQTDEPEPSSWTYQLYVDVGYAHSNNQPENHEWRSKSSTNRLDEAELFLAMGNLRKEVVVGSRWGFEFGLQAGADTDGLETEPPPPALEPLTNADTWKHFYRANLSYLFDAGRGLRLTAGLFNSYIGYESYLAIDNPNYTRGYLLDTVPYFLIGLELEWDVSEAVNLGFYLVNGYDYLTDWGNFPGVGLQVAWTIAPRVKFTQNLYYGPDQEDTQIEFWRFFSDTIVEWKKERFLLAGAVDFGREKQAHHLAQSTHIWVSGALWTRWDLTRRWSVAFRPEFYWDRDGQMTGAKQFIGAYTGTAKYQFSPRRYRLVGTLEVRYDRSNGSQGGYYEGPNNLLVPDQSLVLVGLLWSLGP